MLKNGKRPVRPGEVLREDYLKPLGLSVNALAKRLNVPTSPMNDVSPEASRGKRRYRPCGSCVVWVAMPSSGSTFKRFMTYERLRLLVS